jgi:hypothetical protein
LYIVAFFHRSGGGWKDWRDRSRSVLVDAQCHGWEPVDQSEAHRWK